MLNEISSLHTETIVLLVALTLALVNALVAAFRAETWEKLGRKAMASQNFTGAIHYFSNEIAENPDNVVAYMTRAEAYRLNGDSENALKDKNAVNDINARITPNLNKLKTERTFGFLLRRDKKEYVTNLG